MKIIFTYTNNDKIKKNFRFDVEMYLKISNRYKIRSTTIIPNAEIRKFIIIVPPLTKNSYAILMQEKKVLTNQIILLPFYIWRLNCLQNNNCDFVKQGHREEHTMAKKKAKKAKKAKKSTKKSSKKKK